MTANGLNEEAYISSLSLCLSTAHRLVSTLLRQILRLSLLASIPASGLKQTAVITLPGELLSISNFHVGQLVAGGVAVLLGGEHVGTDKAAENDTT